MYVNVVTFDNTDPQVYGPYETLSVAASAQHALWKRLVAADMDKHTLEISSVVMRDVK